MMLALATGTPFGPFVPARAARVVYLCGEDPAEILHERIYTIARGMGLAGEGNLAAVHGRMLRKNFRAVPMVGMDRVLIGRDAAGNPTRTATYEWLSESLAGMGRVDLVVIDPMSRFYGLDENDNPSATAWIACLEALAKTHGASVLFSHHSSKAVVKDGNITRDTGRGASAIHDGVRMMISMGSADGDTLGLPDEGGQGFIEIAHVKGNYSRLWGKFHYLAKGESLTLTPIDPQEGIRGRQVEELLELLPAEGLSERAILKDKAGKPVRDGLKEAFPKLAIRKELALILTAGAENGKLDREEVVLDNRNGKTHSVFKPLRPDTCVKADPMAGQSANTDENRPDTKEHGRTKSVSGLNVAPMADPMAGQSKAGQSSFPAMPVSGLNVAPMADPGSKKHGRTKSTPTGKK